MYFLNWGSLNASRPVSSCRNVAPCRCPHQHCVFSSAQSQVHRSGRSAATYLAAVKLFCSHTTSCRARRWEWARLCFISRTKTLLSVRRRISAVALGVRHQASGRETSHDLQKTSEEVVGWQNLPFTLSSSDSLFLAGDEQQVQKHHHLLIYVGMSDLGSS